MILKTTESDKMNVQLGSTKLEAVARFYESQVSNSPEFFCGLNELLISILFRNLKICDISFVKNLSLLQVPLLTVIPSPLYLSLCCVYEFDSVTCTKVSSDI